MTCRVIVACIILWLLVIAVLVSLLAKPAEAAMIVCNPVLVPDAVTRPKKIQRAELICSRSDISHIRDDDPALHLFLDPGEDIRDAKVDLAIERANSCDFPERGI